MRYLLFFYLIFGTYMISNNLDKDFFLQIWWKGGYFSSSPFSIEHSHFKDSLGGIAVLLAMRLCAYKTFNTFFRVFIKFHGTEILFSSADNAPDNASRAVQSQKMFRGLKFRIKEEYRRAVLYVLRKQKR